MRVLSLPFALAALVAWSVAGQAQPPGPPPGAPPPGEGQFHPPFVSPMGEPFRPTGDVDGATAWFAGADRNKDSALDLDEMTADAARFFVLLDVDKDGRLIGPEQARYEEQIAPFISGNGFGGGGGRMPGRRGGGGDGRGGNMPGTPGEGGGNGLKPSRPGYDQVRQGAGRFSYLNIAEPVSSADTNLNFVVTQQEFVDTARSRFRLLDADHDGKITSAELPPLTAPRRRR